MITALTHCIILSDNTEIRGKSVLIKGNKLVDVVDQDQIPSDARVIDLEGNYLAPGLIDLQIYGSGGRLFSGIPTVEALSQMENDLLVEGTTGFLATVATNSNDIVEQAITAARSYRKQAKGNFLGLHLEGPYLNAKRKGAHPETFIKAAVLPEIKRWVEKAEGEIRMMTIAPELQSHDVINYLNENGVILSCGHSDASYTEAFAFFDLIPAATHLFNAMPPLHHRQPGLIAAIFDKKPYTSIVADGIHVDFVMVNLAKQLLQEKLFLITDAVTTADKGVYQHVFTGDRYTMPDGTLSGSALTMFKAIENCVKHAGIDLSEAVNMASLYPAKLIKEDSKGRIQTGFDADLISFDKQFNIKQVWLNGRTT